jgi:hypothetical protein
MLRLTCAPVNVRTAVDSGVVVVVGAGPRPRLGASSDEGDIGSKQLRTVRPERLAAEIDGPFVVVLIGMRLNKPWKVRSWVPTFVAMPKMLKQLADDPASGFLGAEGAALSTC